METFPIAGSGVKIGKSYLRSSRKEKRKQVKNAKDGGIADFTDSSECQEGFFAKVRFDTQKGSADCKKKTRLRKLGAVWHFSGCLGSYFWRKKSLAPLWV